MDNTNYRICRRCIMDTTDSEIQFDEQGYCNYCRSYIKMAEDMRQTQAIREAELQQLVAAMKSRGRNNEYDCLVGVSGGVDSTYVAYYLVHKLGLRPLAVHLDNGWDSELAVSNIEKTLINLNIPLYTKVLDWEGFRDLQVAFLKASVANAEIPTDHAIIAALFQIAVEKKIPYIIRGSNFVTEWILPKSWGYSSDDWYHIKALHRRFGTKKLKDFPHYSSFSYWFYYYALRRIREIHILNYIPYDKFQAMRMLQNEFGWRPYGGKHYESIYTRFFQGYILPKKFNIDKRRAHLATLIMAGNITREKALAEIEQDPYADYNFEEEKAYVIKKLNLSPDEFEQIMALPPKSSKDYPTSIFETFVMTKLAKLPLWRTPVGKTLIKLLRPPRASWWTSSQ